GFNDLCGGRGADTFRFTAAFSSSLDVIVDFHHGIDKISISHNLVHLPIGALPAIDFHLGTAATKHHQHIIFDHSTGYLYYDPDGSGPAAQHLFAVVDNSPGVATLSASDIHIIWRRV